LSAWAPEVEQKEVVYLLQNVIEMFLFLNVVETKIPLMNMVEEISKKLKVVGIVEI